MLLTQTIWEVLGFVLDHAWEIISLGAIIYGAIISVKNGSKVFWQELRDDALSFAISAESMFENKGSGSMKLSWVVDQLVSKYAPKYFKYIPIKLSKVKVEKIVEYIITGTNQFKNANKK